MVRLHCGSGNSEATKAILNYLNDLQRLGWIPRPPLYTRHNRIKGSTMDLDEKGAEMRYVALALALLCRL